MSEGVLLPLPLETAGVGDEDARRALDVIAQQWPLAATALSTALLQQLGLNVGAQVGRGAAIIATSESRSNIAYGTLATPDQVQNVVLPTGGLLFVGYHATWQESVAGAARAAIFIGSNQVKVAVNAGGAPVVQEALTGGAVAARDYVLASSAAGLFGQGQTAAHTGDVTTGQMIGQLQTISLAGPGSAFIPIFAAAGTYTVSIQFKASSGSVTAKNRRLYVEARTY